MLFGGHLAMNLLYQMNRVNSRNDSVNDDSLSSWTESLREFIRFIL